MHESLRLSLIVCVSRYADVHTRILAAVWVDREETRIVMCYLLQKSMFKRMELGSTIEVQAQISTFHVWHLSLHINTDKTSIECEAYQQKKK